MAKKILTALSFALFALGIIFFFFIQTKTGSQIISPLVGTDSSIAKNLVDSSSLENYYFDNLAIRDYVATEINLIEEYIPPTDQFLPVDKAKTWLFTYQSDGKTVSGMANIPNHCSRNNPCPVVVMLRGYADPEFYFTGSGTHKAAGIFAENGFITLAPDFLGFGRSDYPDKNVLITRFTRPITVINLLSAIRQWPLADNQNLFIWGHSNGCQIGLSILQITNQNIPTTLWAPVTKGFPESVLHYMDEYENLDESGQKLYRQIKNYTQNYSAQRVSIDYYWDKINAPIQIHQGGKDAWVPTNWSTEFVNQLQLRGKNVYYHYYPEADHNLKENWDEVVEKDVEFFRKYLSSS